MGTEAEIKLPVQDLKVFLGKLGGLRPRRLAERKFEDNFVLDLPQMKLRDKGLLLRVRVESGRGILTFKGPAAVSKNFKIREELETDVQPAEMLEILQKLGYKISFRYQKYRTVYQAPAGVDKKGRGKPVKVMIDETPIGNFAELEGEPESVLRLAEVLGYKRKEFILESYYSLFLSYCKKNGCPSRDMVFR
ncbi:MAG TPA: class IV adenylate cyclase [Acidobacteriota bacterium]|jgi:adenylate cyclase class 2|nr:class IV adenylate cyclase [Acidobacteriota bacterium]